MQKRKIHEKHRKMEGKGCILRASTGMREKYGIRSVRIEKKVLKTVSECPESSKNHENGSERSPRDKSGAFGFENMFWPLGNVARPEGVTGGPGVLQGVCLCAYGDRGACVCSVCTYASGRSMYICRARIISFISIAPINRNANSRYIKGIRGHQQAKSYQKRFKSS